MLRVKAPWAGPLRLLGDRDRDEVLALCDRDPVVNVFVASRVRAGGLDPARLGAQVWGYHADGRLSSVCYAGANLVPVAATRQAAARNPGWQTVILPGVGHTPQLEVPGEVIGTIRDWLDRHFTPAAGLGGTGHAAALRP